MYQCGYEDFSNGSVFAKKPLFSSYFAGVLIKYTAHGGILGKDG